MKKNMTELVFVLDKSGSMAGLEADTIGGYNAMLQKQKGEGGDAAITTVLFSDRYDVVHDSMPISQVNDMTKQDYEVGGMTALLDAIGMTVQKVCHQQRKNDYAGKVLFVITTDGMENASREYDYEKVKAMIERKKTKYNWEFIFLGANIDAISTAAKFGIDKDFAVDYHADSEGMEVNFNAIHEVVTSFRKDEKIEASWKNAIENDYELRK